LFLSRTTSIQADAGAVSDFSLPLMRLSLNFYFYTDLSHDLSIYRQKDDASAFISASIILLFLLLAAISFAFHTALIIYISFSRHLYIFDADTLAFTYWRL
jgi:hypothetical protein